MNISQHVSVARLVPVLHCNSIIWQGDPAHDRGHKATDVQFNKLQHTITTTTRLPVVTIQEFLYTYVVHFTVTVDIYMNMTRWQNVSTPEYSYVFVLLSTRIFQEHTEH